MRSTARTIYQHLTLMLSLVAIAATLAAVGFPAPSTASGPPDPYAVPQPNPQQPQVRALALPPGAVTFANGTNTGPPSCGKWLIPDVNPATKAILCAIVVRPPGGGSLHLLELYTADGVWRLYDLTRDFGYEDCFGGEPELSDFSGTIKVFVNCKDNGSSNGNDRVVFPVTTDLRASD